VLPDALPEGLEHRVEGLDTVRRGGFGEGGDGQGADGPHLLLLVHQTCGIETRQTGV